LQKLEQQQKLAYNLYAMTGADIMLVKFFLSFVLILNIIGVLGLATGGLEKLVKPISYICLIELDSPLLLKIAKELRLQLPIKTKTGRWQQKFAQGVSVVDSAGWNSNFSFCKVTKPENCDSKREV